MTVHVHRVSHPVIDDSLAVIRDRTTPNATFRSNLGRIGTVLLVEATGSLTTVPSEIATPVAPATVYRLDRQPVIVPVLRAGLGLLEPAQQLLPHADVGFVGLARNETTFEPETYLSTLPVDVGDRPVILLDPMLATGGSLLSAIDVILRHRTDGAPGLVAVCALAAPEGIERVQDQLEHPVDGRSPIDLELFVGAIDERLNDSAFIVPGLGDAGDRLFGEGN